jgi:ferredoxin
MSKHYTLIIHGLASGKEVARFDLTEQELGLDLLNICRDHGIPIASSCDGEGVCKKCGIQNGWLTCMTTARRFFELCPEGIVQISYL